MELIQLIDKRCFQFHHKCYIKQTQNKVTKNVVCQNYIITIKQIAELKLSKMIEKKLSKI